MSGSGAALRFKQDAASLAALLKAFSWSFFGLAAVRVWIQCIKHNSYVTTDAGLSSVVISFVEVAFALVVIAVMLRFGFPRRARIALDWFSVTAMTLAGVLFLFGYDAPRGLGLFACVCAGMGLVWGAASWMRFYLLLKPKDALVCALGSLALGSLAALPLGLLPPYVSTMASILMPTLSFVSQRMALREAEERLDAAAAPAQKRRDAAAVLVGQEGSDAAEREFEPPAAVDACYDAEPKGTWLRLLGGLALFAFVLGVARGFPLGESFSFAPGFQVLHQMSVVLLSLAGIYAVVIRGRFIRHSSLWRFELGLVFVGIVLASGLGWWSLSFGLAAISLANSLVLSILWYVSYDLARHGSQTPFLPLALCWCVFLLAREAGRWSLVFFAPYAMELSASGSYVTAVEALMLVLVSASVALMFGDKVPRTRELFADLRAVTPVGSAAVPVVRLAAVAPVEGRPADALPAGGRQASPADGVSADAAPEALAGEGIEHAASQASASAPIGSHPRPADLAALYGLTSREIEVVKLVMGGMSKAEIGKQLFLSENTVRGYVKNAYAKMDVHNKQQLREKYWE